MKKVLVILFIIVSFFILSNCNSFQMLSENDFDNHTEEPEPDQELEPDSNTEPEKTSSFNLNQVSYEIYPSYFSIADITTNNINIVIDYNPRENEPSPVVKLGKFSSGLTAYCTFEIKNTGEDYLILENDPAVYCSARYYFKLHTNPQILIKPGDSTRFTIKNIINEPGFYSSPVMIKTNDPDHRYFCFYIQADLY